MSQKHHIEFKSLLLLLIYLFSNTPAILFHHHEFDIAPYEIASLCEKAIYYQEKDTACHHETHISKALEDCALCDNHALFPHAATQHTTIYIEQARKNLYLVSAPTYHFLQSQLVANKGPPTA